MSSWAAPDLLGPPWLLLLLLLRDWQAPPQPPSALIRALRATGGSMRLSRTVRGDNRERCTCRLFC